MTTCPASNPTDGSRRAGLRACAALALACTLAAVPASALADEADFDALELQVEKPAPAATTARAWKLFVEAALGTGQGRSGQDNLDLQRYTIDGRYEDSVGDAGRMVLSARLDHTRPADLFIDNPVLSLREAYLGWRFDDGRTQVDAGRINLRLGPAYGYNPTDFFRDRALRTVTTVNPFTQRENRLGTVMLRGQRVWSGGSLTVALAPKLESLASTRGLSADWGATNDRTRGLLSLATRWSETVSSQFIVYKETDGSARLGANATALLSDSLVAHGEWTSSREQTALGRLTTPSAALFRAHRASVGLTYTTAGKLSLTGEWQHNGFATDRSQWRTGLSNNLMLAGAYYLQAQALQDNSSRRAWLFYAVQRDFLMKNVELTLLLKHNEADRSRLFWLDLRHRWPQADLALQLQHNHGAPASEFGLGPLRLSVGLVGALYF